MNPGRDFAVRENGDAAWKQLYEWQRNRMHAEMDAKYAAFGRVTKWRRWATWLSVALLAVTIGGAYMAMRLDRAETAMQRCEERAR